MKKHLKRRCIGLCGSLLIGLSAAVFCAAPSSAAQYNDIEGHWAQSTNGLTPAFCRVIPMVRSNQTEP